MRYSRRAKVIIEFSFAVLATMASLHAYAQQPPIKVPNIIYGPPNQVLDLFVPTETPKHTVLLFIHGGGFKQGSKDDLALFAYLYAQGGFVAATMNYRLTSDHYVFPAPLDDVRSAIAWLKSQAPVYGYDARKIILVGYSAGANLALMAGLEDNAGIAAIVSAAGPVDLSLLIATATNPQIKVDMDAYLGGQSPDVASPIFRVSTGDPAVLLFHGDKDTFVPLAQSQLMLKKLSDNHVPAALHVLPNAGHEIMLVYKDNPSLKPILDDITRLAMVIDQMP